MYQKRHRTTFNQYQLTILEEAFKQNSYPSPSFREALASKTNLDSSRVQVWFQNRRAKHKKQLSQAMRYFAANNGQHHHHHHHNHHYNHHHPLIGVSVNQQSTKNQQQQQQQQQSQQQQNHHHHHQQQQHLALAQAAIVNSGATLMASTHSNTPSISAVTPPPVLPISLTSSGITNNLQSNVSMFDLKLDSPNQYLHEQQSQQQQQQQQQLILHQHHQQQQQQHEQLLQQQQQQQQQQQINNQSPQIQLTKHSLTSSHQHYNYYKQIGSQLRSTVDYLH